MKADAWGYHNCVSSETSKLNSDQIRLLIRMGVKEVVIAYDKDVSIQKIRDGTKMLRRFTNVYAVQDRENLLDEKDSPVDKGPEIWRKLYEESVKI
jgi:hypothetical protein